MMGVWEDHARRLREILGPALNKTDRWGRYIPEDEAPEVLPFGREDILPQAGLEWRPGRTAPPLELEMILEARRNDLMGARRRYGAPKAVPMPYDPATPPAMRTLEYDPSREPRPMPMPAIVRGPEQDQAPDSPETVIATPLGRMSPSDKLTGRVDWKFIADREGVHTRGYVPADKGGQPNNKSGVTVATGFDLGGRTTDNLQRLGLPKDLIDTLTPYLGRRGQSAQDYLQQNPLTITDDQEKLVTATVFQDFYDDIARKYNATAVGARFQDLPREAQTAILSVGFQYGKNLPAATPNFWKQAVEQQWLDAHDNLETFGDSWPTRRRAEAALLKKAIDGGRLASRPPPRLWEPTLEWPVTNDLF